MSDDYKVDGVHDVVFEEGSEVPFPFDEVKKGNGVIGLTTDDEVLFVLPPAAIGTTFFLLYPNHLPFSCEFVDSMAAHMNDEGVTTGIKGMDGLMEHMLKRLLKRHGKQEFVPKMISKGDAEHFEGMYYGVMSKLDLAAISTVMQEMWDGVPPEIREQTPNLTQIASMWITAGNGMVSEAERQAVLLMGSQIGNA